MGEKQKRRLYEYAAFHDEPELASTSRRKRNLAWRIRRRTGFRAAAQPLDRKYLAPYSARNFKDVLRQCDAHGVDHRTPMNQTPLMAAARPGTRLGRGVARARRRPDATDQYGCNALHVAMLEAFRDPKFARGAFAALYELLAPAHVDLKTGERLVRIDRHLSEYFLFQTFWTLFKSRFTRIDRRSTAASTPTRYSRRGSPCRRTSCAPHATSANTCPMCCRATKWNATTPTTAHCSSARPRLVSVQSRACSARPLDLGRGVWQPRFAALNLPLISQFSSPCLAKGTQRVSDLSRHAGLSDTHHG